MLLEAAIFDMDGLLIDSEPAWKKAQKEEYLRLNIPITQPLLNSLEGLRLQESVELIFNLFQIDTTKKQDSINNIIESAKNFITSESLAMPGVYEALELFKAKNIPIGLASSSPMILIDTILDKLAIRDYFQVVQSAQFEAYGKPHPVVFLKAAENLQVKPTGCLVFEDSLNGMIAAKAARMKCIGVPAEHLFENPKTNIADLKLKSLTALNWEMVKQLF